MVCLWILRTCLSKQKGRNIIIADKRAEPKETFEIAKLRLKQEIERFLQGVAKAKQYHAKLVISSIEEDTGVKLQMFFEEATLRVNGELEPGDLATFLNIINNAFDYRGDPEDDPNDLLGFMGFTEGVKKQIRDMNVRIEKEILNRSIHVQDAETAKACCLIIRMEENLSRSPLGSKYIIGPSKSGTPDKIGIYFYDPTSGI